MKKIVTIYQTTNLKNNKIYIGSTTRGIKFTKYSHKSASIVDSHKNKNGDLRPIYKAIKKYGFYNFMYNKMAEFDSKKDAYEFKEACIMEFNAMNPKYGYNCTTGSLDKGYKMNKETKAKFSESFKGKKMPESWKIWLKNEIKNNPNKYHSFKKGYKHTEEAKANMRLGQKNSSYIHTEEHKRKIGIASKKVWLDEKFKQKMIKKHKEMGRWKGKDNPFYGKGRKGKDNPMYGRTGALHHMYGKTISKEQKIKVFKSRDKYRAKKRKEILEVIKNRTEKKCIKCKETKSLDMYGKNKARMDKLESWCRECERKRGRINYYKNISPNKIKNRYGCLIKDVIEGKIKEENHENK